jgi:hypothetical protein
MNHDTTGTSRVRHRPSMAEMVSLTFRLSPGQQALGMQFGLDPRLIFRRVDGGDGLAEGIALSAGYLGCRDGLDAAPPLASFGFDLAHFLTGMMSAAVVAILGFR